MGWFGLGRRQAGGEGSPGAPTVPSDDGSKPAADGALPAKGVPQGDTADALVGAVSAKEDPGGPEASDTGTPTTASLAEAQLGDYSDNPPPAEEQEQGYGDKLKAAVLECVDTAKRTPQTFEEALAVLRGERAVKPDYERAAATVAASFAGGCIHGWSKSAALAATYPSHQRNAVRLRAGTRQGVRVATFALIFEGSSAIMEALRKKKDFVGGTVGGGLAGMAYGVSGGLAAVRRGLFYGVWLGGVFGLFRNHVASLREQAKIAEEDERLAQEERDAVGKSALMRSIAGIEAQLETWPTTGKDEDKRKPPSAR
eukprot:jgi/Undpi1/10766/HiC_scaffold_29.g13214.m1